MSAALDALAGSALEIDGIQSAAIFTASSGLADHSLVLAGVAGISGPALDGLIEAVTNPNHPIRRAFTDSGPTFDVQPMNPGGPALRSHLPIRRTSGNGAALGVVAVAHDRALDATARRELEALAAAAAETISQA